MLRFVGGKDEGWNAKDPKDTSLRPAPVVLARGLRIRAPRGEIYGFDHPNDRLIAFDKVDGATRRSTGSRAASGTGRTCGRCTWSPGAEGEPATLVWMSHDGINQADPHPGPR